MGKGQRISSICFPYKTIDYLPIIGRLRELYSRLATPEMDSIASCVRLV